jgi:glutamate/aspartate transport system permease protein
MHWEIFLEQAPFGGVQYYQWLLRGFVTTVELSFCAWIIAFLSGSVFGILRTLPNRFWQMLGGLSDHHIPHDL